MFKRGYANGAKIIEIIEGNLDVVLYNEKETSFYFYRFKPEDVLGRKLRTSQQIVNQKAVVKLLQDCGKTDYQGFINELILTAISNGMPERYEM